MFNTTTEPTFQMPSTVNPTGTIGLIIAIASFTYNMFIHFKIKRCDFCGIHSECLNSKSQPQTPTQMKEVIIEDSSEDESTKQIHNLIDKILDRVDSPNPKRRKIDDRYTDIPIGSHHETDNEIET